LDWSHQKQDEIELSGVAGTVTKKWCLHQDWSLVVSKNGNDRRSNYWFLQGKSMESIWKDWEKKTIIECEKNIQEICSKQELVTLNLGCIKGEWIR
jgi:hypothetical protein